ncbi:hypothetical protein BDR03DRAFT_961100 [Suillus americanus]|nr:hypothetical protein BDR03DRAFT_961100 [Suillus americanus]
MILYDDTIHLSALLVCLPSAFKLFFSSVSSKSTMAQRSCRTSCFMHLERTTLMCGYFNAPLPAVAEPSHNQLRNVPEQS